MDRLALFIYLFIWLHFRHNRAFLTHAFPHTQCYFFDSDVGGFHYGPGHPYVPVLEDDDSTLKCALSFF